MLVAVTGGAGFIGSAVCELLEARGHDVSVIDRVHGADITNPDLLRSTPDHVIHLAGILGTSELFDQPLRAIKVNVEGTLNVLEWCRNVGAGFTGIAMPDVFPSLYTATKVCASRLATAYHHAYDLPVSHVRAFNAFGSGQAHGYGHPRKLIPAFATQAWAGEPLSIWGDGEQTVDLIHVDQVARVLVDAMAFGDDATFDAGTGLEMTVNQVAKVINDITRNEAGVRHFPMRLGEPAGTRICAQGEGWDRLGWRPKLSSTELANTVRSYQLAVAA